MGSAAAPSVERSSPRSFFESARKILHLALPVSGVVLLTSATTLSITGFVGHLGTTALGAFGLSGMVFQILYAMFDAFGIAVRVVAARRLGEGKPAAAIACLWWGVLLASLLIAPIMLALAAFAEPLARLLSRDPAVVALAAPYLRWTLVALAFSGPNAVFYGYWIGGMRPSVPFWAGVAINLSSASLAWCAIYGVGVPPLGLNGAAAALVLPNAIALAINFVLARKAKKEIVAEDLSVPVRALVTSILRSAVPRAIHDGLVFLGFLTFLKIGGLISTETVAALLILTRLHMLNISSISGFGHAASALVSNALGQGKPELASRYGWSSVVLGIVVMVSWAIVYLVAPRWVLGLITKDAHLVAIALGPLLLLSLTRPFEVPFAVLSRALVGAGAANLASSLGVAMQWGLMVPLAYVLGITLEYGLFGIWVALPISRVVFGFATAVIFKRGRWTTIKV
jgi:multidrug resistance protein, MATE family